LSAKKQLIDTDKLVLKADLQFREGYDQDWVNRLAEDWESVQAEAPIEAVETEQTEPGFVDSFTHHRVLAARQLGLDHVTVLVHKVSHAEAVEMAARSNLGTGKPYSARERESAIKAILASNPLATYDELAKLSKSSAFVAKEIAGQQDLARRNPPRSGEKDISATVYRVIGRTSGLDETIKDRLVIAARKAKWGKDETRFAVQQVKEAQDWPEDYIAALLAGETKPVMVSREFAPAVVHLLSAVASPKQSREDNPILALHETYKWARATEDRLEEHGMPDLDDASLRQAVGEADTIINAMRKLTESAVGTEAGEPD
jgi:ParB-like chromosome segregation protein Spo0J